MQISIHESKSLIIYRANIARPAAPTTAKALTKAAGAAAPVKVAGLGAVVEAATEVVTGTEVVGVTVNGTAVVDLTRVLVEVTEPDHWSQLE